MEGTMGRVMSVVNDLILRRDVGYSSNASPWGFLLTASPARRNSARKSFSINTHFTSRFSATDHRIRARFDETHGGSAQTWAGRG